MKILLDSCVWGKAAGELRAAGHDVIWAGDWHPDPGDEEILARASAQGRVLVTLDKDFGELAILHDTQHCGIVRLVNFAARRQAEVCLTVLQRHGDELMAGAIVTAEPGRLRIRAADATERGSTTDVAKSQKPGKRKRGKRKND
jgi:predicted nuclease of predicted toxin-antitoxin system